MEDYVAQAMALAAMAKAKGSTADAYTKAQTDALLDGKADLVDGKIPASELPSYVDDVLEYASTSTFPATGESGKIYVATDTNKTYRWGGSEYVEISESLALGETASTAYAGNKGKANADAIAAIKDGTNIDSFADVETALANIPQVTVDQTYDATSTNAQSGTAVAQAVAASTLERYTADFNYTITATLMTSQGTIGIYAATGFGTGAGTVSTNLPEGTYLAINGSGFMHPLMLYLGTNGSLTILDSVYTRGTGTASPTAMSIVANSTSMIKISDRYLL